MREIISLESITNPDPYVWGRKAAALCRLAQTGSFSIPSALVLSADGPALTDEELGETLKLAASTFGEALLAVRSSSSDEDDAEKSAAGRYTTVLGVKVRREEVRSAVMAVLNSASKAPMAVIIQLLVEPTAAGVAFSADPITGRKDQVLIDAVAGLGDKLASGEATPESWRVDSTGTPTSTSAAHVISKADASRVAELVRHAADLEGSPQDIEWALDDNGVLFLLQARPITGLIEQIPVPVEVPPGFWQRENSHTPLPFHPMTASVVDLNTSFKLLSDRFGLIAQMESRAIGGWQYLGMLPLGMAPKPGKQPRLPGWALALLLLILPQGRQRILAARRQRRTDASMQIVDNWYGRDFPAVAARLEELRDVDPGALTDTELAAHLHASAKFLRNNMHIHLTASVPHYLETTRLEMLCERLLCWSYAQVMELLAGSSEMSSRPSRELHRITEELVGKDREAAIREFQRFFGARSMSIELAEPTYAERPEILAAQLQSNLEPGADKMGELRSIRESAAAKARSQLTGSNLRRFDAALERALKGYPIREHNVFYTLDAPLAVIRYAALEAGRRMVAAGDANVIDDVFFCTVDETAAWLSSRRHQLRDIIRHRRGERAWTIAHPGPASYGTPPELSSLRWLPKSIRELTEVLLRANGHNLAQELSGQFQSGDDGQLRGMAASPGVYEGPARLITTEGQFHRIQPGDVLVCPSTRPSWSVIFSSIGAIVTDSGGDLSHPAIIAREHLIPAVVATGSATQQIRDGEMVKVDGSNGLVYLNR